MRSEHVNKQAVQAANSGLAAAERDLEGARLAVEKLEQKQYYKEQIWSDTIWRNSTYVTFGLIEINIVLLLANIAVFELSRRRKIVREVARVVVEESAMVKEDGLVDKVVRQVDEVVEPEGVSKEVISAEAWLLVRVGWCRCGRRG